MLEDMRLWSRDVASIMLRCLTETAICFSYLAKRGTMEEIRNFVKYGEGQEKLLMLHLQDLYPDDFTLDGLDATDISERLGSFAPEHLNIELGHWIKKDTRKLAIEAGMERIYRLVFSPTSGDLHGNWMSLQKSNLAICTEPMHRFHKLPSFSEPPFFPQTTDVASEIYQHCQETGIYKLNFPESNSSIKLLSVELEFTALTEKGESGEE